MLNTGVFPVLRLKLNPWKRGALVQVPATGIMLSAPYWRTHFAGFSSPIFHMGYTSIHHSSVLLSIHSGILHSSLLDLLQMPLPRDQRSIKGDRSIGSIMFDVAQRRTCMRKLTVAADLLISALCEKLSLASPH